MFPKPSLFWTGVVGVALTAALGYRIFAPRPGQPVLEPVPETLQVSAARLSSEHEHVLRIRNTSGKPVHVEEFLSSCTCAGVSPSQITIPAHGEASVTLTMDLMRYLTPGSDPMIRGELHIAAFVAGKRQKSWAIAIEISRPDVVVFPAGDIDFPTVYQHQSVVPSQHVLFIADKIPAASVSLQANSPAIEKVTLVPVDGYDKQYRAYKLGLALADSGRPAGIDQFVISVASAAHKTVALPCKVNFDAGLRVHVDQPPPIIISKGQDIRWSLNVYRLDRDLAGVEVEMKDDSREASCSVTTKPIGDGTWRVNCRMTAQSAGNHSCQCLVTATLDTGQRLTAEKLFRFYVPRSGKKL